MLDMDETLLKELLEAATGTRADGDAFIVEDSHRLTCYVGRGSRAVDVPRVAKIEVIGRIARLTRREDEGEVLVPVESILGIATAPDGASARRAGFI